MKQVECPECGWKTFSVHADNKKVLLKCMNCDHEFEFVIIVG